VRGRRGGEAGDGGARTAAPPSRRGVHPALSLPSSSSQLARKFHPDVNKDAGAEEKFKARREREGGEREGGRRPANPTPPATPQPPPPRLSRPSPTRTKSSPTTRSAASTTVSARPA
jgi:hypothetical protein